MRAHPKAAFDPNSAHVGAPGSSVRFLQTLYIGAFGGTVGALLGSIWGFGFFGLVTGLMLALAARTAWALFGQPPAPDEYSNGNSRTDEEVRQALADINARKP